MRKLTLQEIKSEEVIKAGEWALRLLETDEYDNHIKYIRMYRNH